MAMQLHELHPSLVHAPLVLLPAAALVDLAAVTSRGRLRRYAFDAAGRRLWWVGVGGALLAGLTGMAASQEIELEDARAHDAMWLHGAGNVGILAASAGLATWRAGHRATVASAAVGLAAIAGAIYTAWLGGELVYTHGAGVRAAGRRARVLADTPRLASGAAAWHLLRDAGRGLGWLLGRGGRLVARREPLARGAATRASEGPAPAMAGPEQAFELHS